MKKLIISIFLSLLTAGAYAQNNNKESQGASNGQPFQQLQQAIDAAEDAANAAIDANSAAIDANAAANTANASAIDSNASAIDANSSAIDSNGSAIIAEAAAREAADAALEASAQAALAAEAAARISADDVLTSSTNANAAAISANTSALEAEEAARIAADAAAAAVFAADLAAEAAARISGDAQLQAAIDAEEAARMNELDLLGSRVSDLESLHQDNAGFLYEETAGLDVVYTELRDKFLGLNYQAGDWFYMGGTSASSGKTEAMCSKHSSVYSAISAYVLGTSYFVHTSDPNGYTLPRGTSNTWQSGLYIGMHITGSSNLPYFQIHGGPYSLGLLDRSYYSQTQNEILVGGYGIGNTLEIRSGADRQSVCGF